MTHTAWRARWRVLGMLLPLGLPAAGQAQSADCLDSATPVASIAMRFLVLSADGAEPGLQAIRNVLEYVGVPHDVVNARDAVLTQDMLCSTSASGGAAKYQGVLLTTGSLSLFNTATGMWESALSAEEWARLAAWQAKYRVRQATFYTYPGGTVPDAYGLAPPSPLWGADTTNVPVTATLTALGQSVFGSLQPAAPIVIRHAWLYQAAATTAAPLLVDPAGNALASINTYADGRQNLALTFDGNEFLEHSLVLGYGVVNWVAKGLYVGQRRAYLSAQPDDLMIADDMWDPVTNRDDTGKIYRITADDYTRFAAWQADRAATNPGLRIDIPFNAFGATSAYPPEDLFPATTDDLTPAVHANNLPFTWLSHTFTHLNLDAATYAQTFAELADNHAVALSTMGLANNVNYWLDSLVTPQISGLNNAEAMRAMKDFGIRWIVSDTSKHCGHRNSTPPRPCPRPNTGIHHDLQPLVLMIPRYPTNLFYNVSTPQEWESEYNHLYRAFWGRDLAYDEILDKESQVWLQYLLNHDMRSLMFHQPNMRAYDGSRSLLGDVIDAALAKYGALTTLKPISRTQRQIGNLMAQRMVLNDAFAAPAPLAAVLEPAGASSTIVITNPTGTSVTVPLTGVNWSGASSRDDYGGQVTSKVVVNGGATVAVPGAPPW